MLDYLPPPKISLLVYSPSILPFINIVSQLVSPSAIVLERLIPELFTELQSQSHAKKPSTYNDFIDLLSSIVSNWDIQDQATLLTSIPRIILDDTTTIAAKDQNLQSQGAVLRRLTVSS
jgi:hypothetical protein